MYRTATTLTALALLSASAGAHEERISYNYAEFRYSESEVDLDSTFGGGDIEGDGFVANGLIEIGDSTHLFVSYDRLEFDDDVDVTTTIWGGGFDFSITPRTDIVLRLGFADARFETPFFEDKDDGLFLSAGMRTMITDDIELYGSLASLDLEDAGEEEIATAGIDFFLRDNIALGPAVQVIDDTTTWSLGAKVYF
ncbi:MAG: hypothetical protein AAFV47_01965 [Pseudomonadota bacterium]